jgi:hypothetical protein
MKTHFLTFLAGALVFSSALCAAPLDDPALQAKVDARIAEIKTWAAAPTLVAAVTAHNKALPADLAAMAQDKWKTLTVLDPFVRAFNKNEAGTWLKAKKTEWVSEAFLSDASGRKVAFLSKPTNWSHAGSPKHEDPIAGKIWQGKVEVDESSGLQQLQIAVPVLVDGKPAGSLVVGLSLLKI